MSNQDGSWLAAIADVTEVMTCMQNASGGNVVTKTSKGDPLGGSSIANSASVTLSKQGRRDDCADTGQPLKKRHKVR